MPASQSRLTAHGLDGLLVRATLHLGFQRFHIAVLCCRKCSALRSKASAEACAHRTQGTLVLAGLCSQVD